MYSNITILLFPCDGLQKESEKAQHESALRTMIIIKIGNGTNGSHFPCSLKIINPLFICYDPGAYLWFLWFLHAWNFKILMWRGYSCSLSDFDVKSPLGALHPGLSLCPSVVGACCQCLLHEKFSPLWSIPLQVLRHSTYFSKGLWKNIEALAKGFDLSRTELFSWFLCNLKWRWEMQYIWA
jgi:hypothetical protein